LHEASKIIDDFLLEKIKKENIFEVQGFGRFLIIKKFAKKKFTNILSFSLDSQLFKYLNKYFFLTNKKYNIIFNQKFKLNK
jgi:hypothetical protein